MKYFSAGHRRLIEALVDTIKSFYGDRLVSVVVYGSYARGENRLGSDLDLLIVLDSIPARGRLKIQEEFVLNVEGPLHDLRVGTEKEGILMEISPLILGKKQAAAFSPLYLDMVAHRTLLEDRDRFMEKRLDEIEKKMKRWGSRRREIGGHWYWEIRPGLKWNEVADYDE